MARSLGWVVSLMVTSQPVPKHPPSSQQHCELCWDGSSGCLAHSLQAQTALLLLVGTRPLLGTRHQESALLGWEEPAGADCAAREHRSPASVLAG